MAQILLVEPDTILGKAYSTALKLAGFDVVVVKTAQDAISNMDTHVPDCLVIEIQLANNNGVELLHELRSHSDLKFTPIIIFSSVSKEDIGLTTEMCNRLGIVGYCYKPSTSLEKLVNVARQATE